MSSGRPSAPYRLTISPLSVAPTVRWMLRMGISMLDRLARARGPGPPAAATRSPGVCPVRGPAAGRSGWSSWRRPAARPGSPGNPGRGPSSGRWPAAASRRSARPIISSIVRNPSSAMISRRSWAMNRQNRSHVLRLAGEALPQLGVLRGHAHRAGVQVALAHHDAAERDEDRRAEAELLGPQQGGDGQVAAGLQLPVHLDADAVAQAVGDQRLLRLRQAQFPRQARVLDARQGAGARAAVVAGDEDHVGLALGHACGDRADADLRDEFDGDAGGGVDGLQVVDQLGQVFDGIDVVVRRRRDERDAGRRVPHVGDLGSETLWPGNWPPSPGLAPWAILIWSSSALMT